MDGRQLGKSYHQFKTFIEQVKRGEKTMCVGEDYVVISQDMYTKQSKELADYKKYADALKNYLNFLDDDIPSNHDSFDDWTKKAENLREKYNLLSPKGEQ